MPGEAALDWSRETEMNDLRLTHSRSNAASTARGDPHPVERAGRKGVWAWLGAVADQVWGSLVIDERIRAREFAFEAAVVPREPPFRDPRRVPSQRSIRQRG